MEIKKGDRFRWIAKSEGFYTQGKIYESQADGRITDDNNDGNHIWTQDVADKYFEKISNGLPDSYFIQPDKINPSHYKAYDVESIEMAIRIWGKEEVAIFSKISAFCYRMRMGMKDDVSIELGKEKWFLNKWKELRDGE